MPKLINKKPLHIGIILDGNRRWAKARSLPSFAGHKAGLKNINKIAAQAFKRGVKIMTVFAFSTENWKRSQEEVDYLMSLFGNFIDSESDRLAKRGWKIKFFGRINDFNPGLQKSMKRAEKISQEGERGQLNICLSYGGRDELVRAVQKIISHSKSVQEVNESLISANLDTAGLPDPDLIIRTSGEQRLSGFLSWQSVYSELLFVDKHWPDFNQHDLDAALVEYEKRQRRYGAG